MLADADAHKQMEEDDVMQKKIEEEWEESHQVSTRRIEQCKAEGLTVLPAVSTDDLSAEQASMECARVLRHVFEDTDR